MKKTKFLNKSLSLLIAVLMVFSLIPAAAFADDSAMEDDPANTITVNALVAINGYDGWEIKSPTAEAMIPLEVAYIGEFPTVLDVATALDEDVTITGTNINAFFNELRGTNGNTWNVARGTAPNSISRISSNVTNAVISDGDYMIFYYGASTAAPAWTALTPLITNPNPVRTQQQRLDDLLNTELVFDKIKGSNISADNVKSGLSALPSRLDADAMLNSAFSVSWASSDTSVVSNSGSVTRPAFGKPDIQVTMTATVTRGNAFDSVKYPSDFTSVTVPIIFTVAAVNQGEYESDLAAGKPVVDYCLENLTIDMLTLSGGATMNPEEVIYDIQLKDPRDVYDPDVTPKTTVDYISTGWWSSDNPDVISVNYLRGAVTRPAPGAEPVQVTLTLTVSKGFYSDSKDFTVTVAPVAQSEIEAVNSELDAVAAALNFDVIKKDNISADAVTSNLQMAYRGIGYPGPITWQTSNSGESGVQITWETSDSATVASYGTVNRPSAADRGVTMTATLTPFILKGFVQPRTVEIPMTVRKVSNSANVTNILLSPPMNFLFDADTYTYNIAVPSIVDNLTVTATTEETGALITSGTYSARGGALTFNVPLDYGNTNTVAITTQGLDTPSNTRTYTLNITRAAQSGSESAVSEILASIAESYKNTADDWTAIDMAAYGKPDDVAGASIVSKAREVYASGSTTDLARSIIALTSLGVNAANVYSGEKSVYFDFIQKLGTKPLNQTMEAVSGLLAFDSGQYNDAGLSLNRQTCIDFLLAKKLTPAAGQSAWEIISSDRIDTTAMVVAALAPYYNSNADVKTAIDGAVAYLSAQQNSSGHFGNSNATSMVIVAAAALGFDPGANTGIFSKSGKSLIDGILYFKTSSDRFGVNNNTAADSLATEQGFRALVAYRGYLYSGYTSYNIYDFGAQSGDGAALTGETDPGIVPPDPDAPKNMTVRIEDIYTGATLMPETSVNLNGTYLDALKAALAENGYDPAADLTESYGYISAILGVSQGDETGWMYAINGEIPTALLSEAQVAEGDQLIMFFMDWYDSFYFTKFDKSTANIQPGGSVTLTLTGVDPWSVMQSSGVYEPIPGATVFATNTSGQQIGTDVKTDASGKATLTFASAGTYTVSAKRQGVFNATDLVPPLCTVTVSADPVNLTVRVENLKTGTTLLPETTVRVNGTQLDALKAALTANGKNPKTDLTESYGYISAILGVSGDSDTGWLYAVNGEIPFDSLDAIQVNAGDSLVLFFMNWNDSSFLTKFDKSAVSIKAGESVTFTLTGADTWSTMGGGGVYSPISGATVYAMNTSGSQTGTTVKDVNTDINGKATLTFASAGTYTVSAKRPGDLNATDLVPPLCTVTVTSASGPGGSGGAITVYFTLQGLNKSTDADEIWLNRKAISIDSGATVPDVIIAALTEYGYTQSGAESGYIRSVTTPSGFTLSELYKDMPYSGWLFKVNSKLPEVGMDSYTVKNGDSVLLYFTKDFTKDSDAGKLSGGGVSAADTEITNDEVPLAVNPDWVNPFSDVNENNWFYDAVNYVNSNGLMTGTSADKFSPNTPMTRAMLVTVLYRYSGEPEAAAANPFTDVADGQWYTDAVVWAYDKGIVSGYGHDMFGTNDEITREQLVTILYNYAKWKELDLSKSTDLSKYTDLGDVSSWASEAMHWAVAEGVITGRTATTLAPKGTATRAETATLLMRFIEL